MQQLKLLLVPIFAAVVLFFAIDTFERVVEPRNQEEITPVPLISGYSEGINTIRFDAQGRIEYTLSAVRQVSYRDSSTEFNEPFVQLYREDESRWNIIADSGRISTSSNSYDDVEEILLTGGVEVYQLDEFGNRTVLATEELTVDPAAETLRTNLLVTLLSDRIEQSAVGMHVDLNTEEYVFFRDIRGRYANPEN